MAERITVETSVKAPAKTVWHAYTSPEHITKWNSASDDWHCPRAMSDLRVGGKFSSRMEARNGSMGFDFEGTFTKIVEQKLIEYSFGDRAATVEFTPKEGGVAVRVTFDAETTFSLEQQRSGWQAILDRFARHAESLAIGTTRKIAPCLWFADHAEEAARFYVSIFPGSSIDNVHRSAVDTPGTKAGSVLFVEFTIAGQRYQALNGGSHVQFSDAISLSVDCADQAEVDRYWAALTADGGKPVACGWLKDKYGLSWQIIPRRLVELLSDPDRAKAKRVMEAMMQMVKIDVAALEAAARGT